MLAIGESQHAVEQSRQCGGVALVGSGWPICLPADVDDSRTLRPSVTASWCALLRGCYATFGGMLPEAGTRELFDDPDTISAGAFNPVGVAHGVPGGYRVTGIGRWEAARAMPAGSSVERLCCAGGNR